MGFTFDTPKTVEICGKEYECDPGNPDIVLGASRDFQKIIAMAHELKGMVEDSKNLPRRDYEEYPAEAAMEFTKEVFKKNQELTQACRGMIEGCLGVEEYQEIFRNRRPNSTEHLKLCTYLFEYITEGRDLVVEQYLDLPEGKKYADGDPAQGNPGKEDRDGLPQVDEVRADVGFPASAAGGEVQPVPSEHSWGNTTG